MTNSNQTSVEFPACKRRKVQANFNGGDVSSDGGGIVASTS